MRHLLDTCVISELGKPRPSRKVTRWLAEQEERHLAVSVLTIGELRKGIAKLPSSRRRERLVAWVEQDLRDRFAGRVLPVSEAIASLWGRISGEAEKAGCKLPAIDALIAATAMTHGLRVITRNTPHISRAGAEVFNPWKS